MEYYYGKQPNLIGPIMKSTVTKAIKQSNINNTISDKITSYIENLYKQYIIDNKIVIFIIIIIVLFLFYRYYNKNNKNNKNSKNEHYDNNNNNLLKEINKYQQECLITNDQPTMNPIKSIDDQPTKVYYPPDPLPINIPEKGLVYTRNLYEDPKSYSSLNHVNYDYNAVHGDRSYYLGTYPTYQSKQDTTIINPYSWSNDFNTNSGNFVNSMTNKNMENVMDYQTILNNMENDLSKSN